MARIPDENSLTRSVPSSGRGIVNIPVDPAGEAVSRVGGAIQRIGGQMAAQDIDSLREKYEAQRRVNKAQAALEYTKAEYDVINEIRQDPSKYASLPERYQQVFSERVESAKQYLGGNDEDKLLLEAAATEHFMRSSLRINQIKDEYHSQHIDADIIGTQDMILQNVRPDMPIEDVENTYRIYAEKVKGYAPIKGEAWAVKQQIDMRQKLADARYSVMDPRDVQRETRGMASGDVVDMIMKTEIGSGALREHPDGVDEAGRTRYAIGGINSGSYPKQFGEVKAILAREGQDAARQYVREFYSNMLKERGVDKLPADVQAVVADGLVNHNYETQQLLVKMAKDGATRQELIQVRRDEYRRLVEENPKKYGRFEAGWKRRLDSLEVMSPAIDMQVAQKWNKQTAYVVREDLKERMKNDIAQTQSGASGSPLSMDDFVLAGYGDAEYGQYLAERSAAQFSADAATMSQQQMSEQLQRFAPTQGSPTFADDARRYEAMLGQAKKVVEDREKDFVSVVAPRDPAISALKSESDAAMQNLFASVRSGGDIDAGAAEAARASSSAYFAALDDARGQLGVNSRALLSNQEADSLAERISTIGGADKSRTSAYKFLESLKFQYGDYYDRVIEQVSPKLSGSFRLALEVPSTSPALATDLAFLAAQAASDAPDAMNKSALESKLASQGGDVNNMVKARAAMLDEMQDFVSSLYSTDAVSGDAKARKIIESMTNVAVFRMGQGGMSFDAAMKSAAAELTGHYSFVEQSTFNGATEYYRIPAYYDTKDGRRVELSGMERQLNASASTLKRKITADDIMLDDLVFADVMTYGLMEPSKESVAARIREYGYWATNKDESGLVLKLPSGQPVKRADGTPFEVRWDELTKVTKERESKLSEISYEFQQPVSLLGGM